VPLPPGLYPQAGDVEHDDQVDDEDQGSQRGGMPEQVGEFERDVNRPRGNREPLRPGERVPEAIGLHEAQDGVNTGHHRDLPEAHIADPGHEVNEDSDVVVARVSVEKLEKALGHAPDVFVPHREHTQAGQDHDDALGEFNRGYGADAFDVFGILDLRVHAEGGGQSLRLSNAAAQLIYDFPRSLAGLGILGDFE
jgi:hypothetical protein